MSEETNEYSEAPMDALAEESFVEEPQTAENEVVEEVQQDEVDDNNSDDNNDDDFNDDNRYDTKTALDEDDLNKIKTSKRSIHSTESSQTHRFQKERDGSKEFEEEQLESNEPIDVANKRRQELEAKMERALKKPKIRKRKDEHDLTNDEDELIQILKQEMDLAAKKDSELISQKDEAENEGSNNIAINKVQLLPRVDEVLSKANLAEVILDNNLLAEVRQWLEPLPDASLPSYEIQKVLFNALLKLPINTNHLRESGIGKILLFYQKSKRVEPRIKRIADKLISDWTRPIIGASDNYRDKQINSVDFDSMKFARSRQRSTSSTPGKKSTTPTQKIEKSIYEQQAERRNRAAAPIPTVSDYKFAPKSRIDKSQSSLLNAGVGTSLNRDDQFKRINQKLSGRRTATKKGGVSIEGRSKGF